MTGSPECSFCNPPRVSNDNTGLRDLRSPVRKVATVVGWVMLATAAAGLLKETLDALPEPAEEDLAEMLAGRRPWSFEADARKRIQVALGHIEAAAQALEPLAAGDLDEAGHRETPNRP